jgi:hypothetical protein
VYMGVCGCVRVLFCKRAGDATRLAGQAGLRRLLGRGRDGWPTHGAPAGQCSTLAAPQGVLPLGSSVKTGSAFAFAFVMVALTRRPPPHLQRRRS